MVDCLSRHPFLLFFHQSLYTINSCFIDEFNIDDVTHKCSSCMQYSFACGFCNGFQNQHESLHEQSKQPAESVVFFA